MSEWNEYLNSFTWLWDIYEEVLPVLWGKKKKMMFMSRLLLLRLQMHFSLLRPYIGVSECKTGKRYLEDNKKRKLNKKKHIYV